MLKNFLVILLIAMTIVLTFPGNAEGVEWTKWEEAPPIPLPFMSFFSVEISQDISWGEIIIAKRNQTTKIQGSKMVSFLGTGKETETVIIEAVHFSDEEPTEMIEMMWRGKGEHPSFIQEEELKEIISAIEESGEWIILEKRKIRSSPF